MVLLNFSRGYARGPRITKIGMCNLSWKKKNVGSKYKTTHILIIVHTILDTVNVVCHKWTFPVIMHMIVYVKLQSA